MTNFKPGIALDDNTPVLVAAGQYVEREASLNSPMELAASAAKAALQDAKLEDASAIDTIAVVRLFSDSAPNWHTSFGRSNNPPQSIANRIEAKPAHCIYSEVSGTQPVSLLLEMCAAIARGEKSLAMIVGVEAIANQRYGDRNKLSADWSEELSEELDDRGYGELPISHQELANGLFMAVYYYALIENARAHSQGLMHADYSKTMGTMFSAFSEVARDNPYAQFPIAYSAKELTETSDENYLISTPYNKRMVSQDRVNQAAALLVTSVGKARELGIPEDQWLFPHGFAQASDHPVFQRPDITTSKAMQVVMKNTLAMAQCTIDDIDLIDIYSCFPCAVSSVAETLGLPTDGERPLTLTGGLPFFGGPGNNYSMHGLAEMSLQLRHKPASKGLLTANGGMLSKHAAVVLSRQPAVIDWHNLASHTLATEQFPCQAEAKAPTDGTVITYTVQYKRGQAEQAIIVGEQNGERFVATSQSPEVITQCLEQDPIGRSISVNGIESVNSFHFAK